MTGEPRSVSRVVAGFSSYDGDLSLPLGLALGSPIFPSGCEGKLGVALEPPRHAHGDLTSLAPHERLPEILVVPRRDEVPALLVARRGEAVTGDDGLTRCHAQHHCASQSPHDKLPALGDGAVEASLRALQGRDILGALYDFTAGSTG